MFCTNCGAEIRDHVKFCPKCGKPVRKASAAGSPDSQGPSTYPTGNGGGQSFWQSAPMGPIPPQSLSTLATMELIDCIVWAIIGGLQILYSLYIFNAVLTLGSVLYSIGLGSLLGDGWLNGFLLLLIGCINVYYAYQSFRWRNAIQNDPPMAVIAHYQGQLSNLIAMLIYNLLFAPIGVLCAIYALVIRWYALSNEGEIMPFLEQDYRDKMARGEKPPIFWENEAVLVQDMATEQRGNSWNWPCGVLYLTDQRILWLRCDKKYVDTLEELAVFQNGIPQMTLNPPKKFRITGANGKVRHLTLSGARSNQWQTGMQQLFGGRPSQPPGGPVPQPPQSGNGRTCPSCGSPVPAGQAFCVCCGARQQQ